MNDRPKQNNGIPCEFASLEEAADFWDVHDTTEFADATEALEAEVLLKRRRFEFEIDEDLIPVLKEQAQEKGVDVKKLISELLREKLKPAA